MPTLMTYAENWAPQFEEIKRVLLASLTRVIRIEHVGSTAIAGMLAKPVIDLDVVIATADDFEQTRAELATLGYHHLGNLGIPEREAFNRLDKTKTHAVLDKIAHHLYVCPENSPELRRHLLLRDYLSSHSTEREAYIAIKQEIIRQVGPDNRAAYVDKKEKDYGWFFEKIVKEAEAEKLSQIREAIDAIDR